MEKVIRSLSVIRFKIIRVTFSQSTSCVFWSCFFENKTTSSTFLVEAMLNTVLIALRRTSISALEYDIFRRIGMKFTEYRYLDRTWRTSTISPSRTCPCLSRGLSRRSSAISFRLWDSLRTRVMKQDAAAHTGHQTIKRG